MSHPSANGPIGEPLIVLDQVDSTNNYAMGQVHAGLATHGFACFANHQFAGKGQRGKSWISAPGQNITLSIVLNCNFPGNEFPFLLSASIALASYDLLDDLLKTDVSIKWPNDLYWRDRKTGGILIENIIQGSSWKYAVAGIGININQVSFPSDLRAVSVRQVRGQSFDPLALARSLCTKVQQRYEQYLNSSPQKIMEEYNSRLFKKNEVVRLRKENIAFETTIKKVTVQGDLITQDTIERNFRFGEVEWL